MSSWGELEEVQSGNVTGVNSWQVSGGSLDKVVLVSVDDEWAFSNNVSGVSHLSVTFSDLS